MAVKTYIDNRTYEQLVEDYESEKIKLQNEIKKTETEIETLKSRVDNARDQIDKNTEKISEIKTKSNVTEAEKKEAKLLSDKIPKLEQQISECIDEIAELEPVLKDLTKELEHHEWMEICSRTEFYCLSRARNEYFKTGDIQYLRKAVHSICSYADSLRYGSKYVAPYKGHPLEYDNSPFSEDATDRMNFNSQYEWFKEGKLVEDW